MEYKMISTVLGCLILVHITVAQECAVNQCSSGLNCYDRDVPGELPYVCECNVPFSQGIECTESADNQEVFTCYGDSCQSGIFRSINYPSDYNNRYRALYLLYVPGAQSITFSFSVEFDIEEFKDELYIGSGLMYNDVQLDGLGSPPDWHFFEGSIRPQDFTIQGDVAWMYFGTDKNIQRTGFEVSWNALVDNTPPVFINCPSNIGVNVEIGTPSASVTWTVPTAVDASSVSTVSSHNPGQSFTTGTTTTVVYTATDAFANVGQCAFTITVTATDTTPPVVTVSSSTITRQVEVGTPGVNVFFTEPTATDNSGQAILISRTNQPGDFFSVGQTIVTYTFQDPSGNPASGTVTINVIEVDNIPPVVTVSSSTITRQVEVGSPGVNVFFTEPTATDNSGIANLVSSTNQPGDFFSVGQTIVTYTFQDPSGNPATGTVTINVIEVDNIPPVVTVSSSTITRQVEVGSPGVNVFFTEPTATDNSGIANLVSSTNQPGDFFSVGQTIVTYTFQDPSGNPATGTVTINVIEVDTTPPVVTVSSSTITRQVEVGSPGVNVFFTEPTATDNSGIANLVSRTNQPGDFFSVGQTIVTYTFQDPSGNPASGTVTINVIEVDTTPPVVTVPSSTITRQVEVGSSGVNVFYTEPTATDNSGQAILTSRTNQPGDFFPVGQTTVTYTFQDPSGNPASGTVTINVIEVDTTPPVVTVPSTTITRQVEVGSSGVNVFYTEPTATDNSGQAILTSRTNQPGDFFPVGQTTVTYTFQDPSGNPASATVTINVIEVDTTPPVVTVPSTTITRQVEIGTPGVNVFYTEPTATDNSGIANLVSRTNQPGDFFPVGQTDVTYTFQDPSGNPSSGTVTINVVEVDTTSPVITVPSNTITREVELGTPGVNVFYTEPTATDNSGIANLVSRTNQPGDFFNVGQTVVTYTFQDPSGNPASGTVTINVVEVDTTPPQVFVTTGEVVRTAPFGSSGVNVFFTEPVAIDNSGTADLVSQTAQPGDFFPIGSTVVTYRYRDASGNEATGTFTVTVEEMVDTTPPTVTVSGGNIVRTVELGQSRLSVIYTEPTATDNSGEANLVSRTAQPGDLFPVGTTTVEYVYQDPAGNEGRGQFTVTVIAVDTTPPSVNCPNNVFQEVELGTSSAPVFFTEPTAFDISGQANLVTRTAAPGDSFPVGTTSVSYIFSDNSGNEAEPCTFTVTISAVDTTPPTVNCINNVAQTVQLGTGSTQVFFTEPTAFDISGQTSLVTRTSAPGDSFPVGTTSVTYIFTDASGNNAQPCTFNVVINAVDTTPPTVNCANNIAQTIELGSTSAVVNYAEPSATDISGTAFLVSRSSSPGDSFPIGSTTVTYIFSDQSGNEAPPCVFTVTIGTVDTMMPMFTSCPNNIVQSVELGVPGTVISWTTPTANDAAGIASIVSNLQPGSFFTVGESATVTYVATDNSGLTDNSCSFTVTVFAVDTTPPSVVCTNNVFQTVELGTNPVQVFYTEPTASDISGQANLVSRTNVPGDSFPVGTSTVTYVFADNSGNTADACSFTITVTAQDTTPPTVNCITNIVRTVELGTSSVQVFYNEPTASDLGQASLVSRTAQPGDNFPVGVNPVTYVFGDNSGNQADPCTFTITVNTQDTTPPTVTCISDITRVVELGTTSVGISYTEPTATDISGTATLDSRSHTPGQNFPVGSTVVSYFFSDASGNNAQVCSFTVTVNSQDTTPPTVSNCPSNIVQSVELGTPGATVTFNPPTATDVAGVASIVSNVQSGTFITTGETRQVTYTVTDNSGLTDTSCTFTITVFSVDTTPPVITVPSNTITRVVELGNSGVNVFYSEPTASDISGTANLVSRTAQPGDFFPVGQTVVTYTFRDPSGNPATGTVTVNVIEVDTTPPSVVCTSSIVQTVELGTASAQVFYTEPTASDVSGQAILESRTNMPGDSFPVGTTTVTYIFADNSGNTADDCSFTITITAQDTTPPSVICTNSVSRTVELGTTNVPVFFTEPTASDISGVANLVTRTAAPGDSFPVGVTTVTYIFSDNSGNQADPCVFTITVDTVDTTPPSVTCIDNIVRTIELGTSSVVIFYSEPSASDVSGQAFLSSRSNAPGDSFPVGTTVVSYIFTDPSGNNADPCVFTVTVTTTDTTDPTVTNCPSDIVQTVELGTTGTSITYNTPTATDLAGIASITSNVQSGTFFSVNMPQQITFTVTDNNGNTNTDCTFTVNVIPVDTTPPTINVPSNTITRQVELGEPGVNVDYPEPTASDISGVANLVSRTAQPGDFFPVGQTVVTYTFQDPSGNPASGTVTVNVVPVDTTPPTINVPSNTITRQVELGTPGLNINYPEPTASDISGVANLVSRTAQPGDFFPVGQTVVTYTFQDPSGNPASGTVTVNVVPVDTTPPTITVPSNTITRQVELGTPGVSVFYQEPTATDISGTANLVSRTAQPGDFFPVGQTVVTYTYEDPSGNPASGTVTVNVETVDTTPPTITVPSNTITRQVELGTPGVSVFYQEPTATDISGTANLVSRTAQPGDFFPVGQTVVTYTYEDPSGNPASGTVTVNVETVDTTPPTITVPSNTITRQVELGTPGLSVVYPEPTATDISGVANLVSRTAQPGDFFLVGQTVVTYTYEDPSGNPASGTVTVNVVEVDTTPPVITVPSSTITRVVELGTSGVNVVYQEPTATDISGTANLVSRTAQSGDFFPVGQTVVSYTFRDPSGNPATGTVTVNVIEVDTTPPSVVCTSSIVQTVELGTASVQVSYTEPTASDVSGQANLVSRTNTPGESFPVGTTTVTYVFADNSGNTADDCSFTITITAQDTTPPSVICTNSVSRTVELGTTSVPVFFTEPTASDISGVANLVTRTAAPGDNYPVGVTTVTYIFSDNSGNQADPCVFTITVDTVDTTPPSVTCVDNIVRTVELGTSGTVVFYSEPSASDISGQPFLSSRSNAPGDSFPVGTTVVSYIFTDPSGNNADPCVFTVTVTTTDTTDPTVTNCPSDIVQTVELGITGTGVTFTTPTTTDLAGIASVTSNVQSGTFFSVNMPQQITFTVTDNNGNTNTDCTFTVTVIDVDTTPPSVVCVSNINEIIELGVPSLQINYPEPTASDISGTTTLVSRTNLPGEFFPVGTTEVTYIFTDASQNEADPCTFTITVTAVDTTPPSVTCQSAITRVIELGNSGVEVFYNEPSATDISGQVNLLSQSASSGDVFPVGVTSVTYIFGDNSGNQADPCTFTVTVDTVDTTPPTVQCIDNIFRNVELGTPSLVVFYSEPSASDISGQPLLDSRTSAPGDAFPIGTTTVSYIFSDPSGNDAPPCIFTVTISATDTTTPTVTNCPSSISQSVELGTTGRVITYTAPTGMDLSGIASIVPNIQSGTFFAVGETRQVVYTVTDNSGLTDTSCAFTVTIFSVDTTPPDVTCAMNIIQSVELGTQSVPITYEEPTATDISGVAILTSQTHSPGNLFPVGQTTVTYIFADGAGNEADPCTFVITIIADDTTHPTVVCTNDVTRTIELGNPSVEVFYQVPTATDISGTEAVISNSNNPGDIFPVGQTTVTYVFADESGNVAPACSFLITVNTIDTTPPTVQNCPQDVAVTVELGTASTPVVWGTPSATDISGTATIQSQTRQPGDEFGASTTTTVTYIFVDASNNLADPCTFTVTVNTEDTTSPSVQNCPADIVRTIEVNSATQVPITWSPPTATDTSGTQFISSQTHSVGQSFPLGTTQVIYIFSDASGNDADPCAFNVIILTEDTTAPVVLNCPADITETTPLNSGGTVITFIVPTAVDNSNQEPTVSISNQPNTFFGTGETVVTYTFTDQAGNPSSCSFTVTVIEVDTEKPVIQNCPTVINVNTPLGTALTPVNWPSLQVSDNSGQTSVQSQSASSGDSFPPGRTTVTIIYQDPSSNTDTCQFSVIVTEVDNVVPEILSCPSDIVSEVPVEASGSSVTWTSPVVTDNSGLAPTVTSSSIPGSFFLRGTTQVTYTFTDNSGNQVSCSFVVTVIAVDDVAPIVVCPENSVQTVLEGVDNAYVTFDLPTVTDNNGATNLVSSTANSGDAFPVGTTVVTFNYADTNNNEASCSFSVTVLTDTPCAPNPCFNGGACVVNSLTEYQCVCTECFTGTNCETQLNACDANLCQNGAACMAYEGSCDSYFCECPSCFVGVYCDVPVDACDNHQCQNGAACVLDDNTCLTYTCSCPLCYTGQYCQAKVDACDNNQCQNGAACEAVGELCTEYTCQCSGCFTGDLCDEVRDPCSPSPCLNNAQCNVLGDNCYSYTCECVGCFTGFNCEDPITSPCENSPCQNGGVCSAIAGVCSGYQCTCQNGFAGVNCEDVTIVNTNPCNNFPCANGATCVNIDSNDYTCLCRSGYTGINCQTPTANAPGQDPCNSSPCQNGATCVNSYDSNTGTNFYLPQYTCICETGYTGPNCGSTTAANPLLDVCTIGTELACQNGGACKNMYQSFSQDMDYYCDCPIGWTGHTCETPSANPCASGPCENGGICNPSNTYFECDCPAGFFGTTCEVAQGDNEPPTISNCPEDITRTISSGSGVSVSWLEPTATDAGTTQRFLRSHVPGSFFQLGDTAVTYVFSDNSANLARCSFFVTVTLAETDNVPPVVQNCPSTTVAQATGGSTNAQVSWIEPSATDDSGTAVRVSNNYSPGQSFPVGETVVAYTFTDDAGNQNTCTFSVRVVVELINQSPTVTFCPSGSLVYSTLGADEVVVNFPAPTAVDDSGFSPSVNSNYLPGQSFAVGSYTVTYTFTDNAGLTSDCTFNMQVVSGGDVRPPTISNCPEGAVTALAAASATGASVSWTVPTASDESGSVSSTSNYSPGAVFPIGTTTVTYTFTDLAGNEARCLFNVIVTGTNVNETPAPSNLNLSPGTSTITATWSPPNGAFNSYQITVSGGSTVNTETLPQSSSSYTITGLNPATSYTVTLTANGNTGSSNPVSASTTTSPEQGQPPSSPSNIRLSPNENSVVVFFDAASGDITGYSIGLGTTSSANDVTATLSPGSTGYTFSNLAPDTLYFVSLQAFNNFGSSQSVVESITTSNVVVPGSDIVIANCPVALAASLPFGTFAFVDWEEPTATSSVGAVTRVGGPFSPSGFFQLGVTPIIYEFEDVNGNSATCAFSIYVTDGSDTTAPEITFCPSNVFVQAASGASSATASWDVPTATDASEPITAVSNYSPGDSFDVGTYLVFYNLIDSAGFYSTCSFEVTVTSSGVVIDRENPVLNGCPTNIVANASPGSSTTVVSWLAPVASDNSGSATLTVNRPPGSSFAIGSTQVTYTATDPTGNFVTCSFDIIVLSSGDNTAPVLSNCPSDQTVFASQNAQGAVATWSAPTASDNSGDFVSINSDFSSGTVFPIGVSTVTYTATDSSGNQDTCQFSVTVIGATDNVGPVTSNCPTSQTVNAAVGASSAVATWSEPIFTDASGVATVTSNFVSGSSFAIGTSTVTYTATDFLGNSGECSFNIFVNTGTDGTRPTFLNCPSNIDVTVPFGSSGTSVTWTEPIAVDNSGVANSVVSQSPGSFFAVGATNVVYTATDLSGNTGTCSFFVTVSEEALVDVTPPELFNCPTGISATANPGSSFAAVTWTPPTATDNLGVPAVSSNFPSGSSFPIGTTLVTYTAIDNFGNDASCSFNVVVSSGTSNSAPIVTFCPNNGQIYFTAPASNSVIVNFAPPTATDDSGSVTSTSSNLPGDEFPVGVNTVTYTFSDDQGLTASCSFSFEVQVGANPCSSNPCAPSEQCFYIPSRFLCIANGRRRREAEMLDLSDICPCQNGGMCLLDDATSSATCECPIGYAGVLCQMDTMPAANVNVHNRYADEHEIQEWSNGNSALLWSVIICMAIMLVVVISLSGLLCYVIPRIGMARRQHSKIDEIPILQ
ncbi:mucin-17 isoform X7 [Strongylocentrotus purpuratus]|uniref:Hyalin n=1 Tax=Strongylocentrotus purpuratus TaxID=7668 RepID=A0A7M7N087_STRPU|nr:mucin-17 isoform X7 [Strongylocentrotus purpuratus]